MLTVHKIEWLIFSSINSDTRADAGDGDSCDPGYARVKTTEDPEKLEQLEITERELDKLYSNVSI